MSRRIAELESQRQYIRSKITWYRDSRRRLDRSPERRSRPRYLPRRGRPRDPPLPPPGRRRRAQGAASRRRPAAPDDVWGRVAEVGGAVAGFSRSRPLGRGRRHPPLSALRLRGAGVPAAGHRPARCWRTRRRRRPRTGTRIRAPARPCSAATPDQDRPDTPGPAARRPDTGSGSPWSTWPATRPVRRTPSCRAGSGRCARSRDAATIPRIHEALRTCFADSGHGQHTQTYEDYLSDVRDVDLWLIAWDGDDDRGGAHQRAQSRTARWTRPGWPSCRPGAAAGSPGLYLQRSLRLLADHGVTTATIRTVAGEPQPHRRPVRAGRLPGDRPPPALRQAARAARQAATQRADAAVACTRLADRARRARGRRPAAARPPPHRPTAPSPPRCRRAGPAPGSRPPRRPATRPSDVTASAAVGAAAEA